MGVAQKYLLNLIVGDVFSEQSGKNQGDVSALVRHSKGQGKFQSVRAQL